MRLPNSEFKKSLLPTTGDLFKDSKYEIEEAYKIIGEEIAAVPVTI